MTPYLDDGDITLYHGDSIDVLRTLPAGIAQTCVTSPPYWGLRDYGTGGGQMGLEQTPDEYVTNMVALFREVRRVLRDDGTLWLNLGDAFADKQMQGMPWRVAFALQQDGWYLRSDIIWSKPNPMPESVTDRPTKSHEYVFLLSKGPRYFYDADAIREDVTGNTHSRGTKKSPPKSLVHDDSGMKVKNNRSFMEATWDAVTARNRRSVWTIPTEPFPEAHFATYPQALVTPCILAGSRPGDLCLDPFVGSGTTCLVARKHGRRCIGIDLNADYLNIAARRTQQLSLLGGTPEPVATLDRPRGLTGGAYNPPGQTPHSNARTSDHRRKQ